jgi:hypothetical protein
MPLLVVKCMTLEYTVGMVVVVCLGGREGGQMRQRLGLRGCGTALVVPLHERHDECGAGGLDNMEQV